MWKVFAKQPKESDALEEVFGDIPHVISSVNGRTYLFSSGGKWSGPRALGT